MHIDLRDNAIEQSGAAGLQAVCSLSEILPLPREAEPAKKQEGKAEDEHASAGRDAAEAKKRASVASAGGLPLVLMLDSAVGLSELCAPQQLELWRHGHAAAAAAHLSTGHAGMVAALADRSCLLRRLVVLVSAPSAGMS